MSWCGAHNAESRYALSRTQISNGATFHDRPWFDLAQPYEQICFLVILFGIYLVEKLNKNLNKFKEFIK